MISRTSEPRTGFCVFWLDKKPYHVCGKRGSGALLWHFMGQKCPVGFIHFEEGWNYE